MPGVRRRRPLHQWKTGVPHDTLSGRFKPDQPGVYTFAVRVEQLSNGAKSEYSPALSITVT
jgi:hypothetical protein